MKIIFCMFLLLHSSVFAQEMHEISIGKIVIPTELEGFQVAGIIDGRADKSNIGWVQTGMFNKKKIATFKEGFVEEINGFISRSFSMQGDPVVVRITQLDISEQTTAMSETSKAALFMDFFLKQDEDSYYFITSNYSTVEKGGMDVTHHHPENIGKVIVMGLEQFSRLDWKSLTNKTQSYTMSELVEGTQANPDVSSIAILNTEVYRNGVFAGFSDFLTNAPSDTSGYEVKVGKKVKLWTVSNGVKSRVKSDVYGFAHNNQLYVLFHKSFYLLRKEKDNFYFTGPHIPNQAAVATGAIIGGAIGGAIAASASGGRSEYKIDLVNGRIVEVNRISNAP